MNYGKITDIPGRYRRAVDLFKEEALAKYGNKIEDVILFGSVARDQANEDSDIDILVVWKGKRLDGWHSLEEIAFRVLLQTESYISLKIFTPEQVGELKRKGDPFLRNVGEEGIDIAY